MHFKIATISGLAGTGKSTLAEYLVSARPDQFRYLVGTTTRAKRDEDIDEYKFLTMEEFVAKEQRGEFWNAIEIHGNWYGFEKHEVAKTLSSLKTSLRIITPHYAEGLTKLAPGRSIQLYFLPPSEEVLRQRMLGRGDSEAEIERRIEETRDWDDFARRSGKFVLIQPGTIEQTRERVLRVLR